MEGVGRVAAKRGEVRSFAPTKCPVDILGLPRAREAANHFPADHQCV